MAVNLASFHLDATKTRDSEYTGTPFADTAGDGSYNTYLGCNRAASNAPGIGIATANGECKLSDWTVLDQAGAARDPQDSQHIGVAAVPLLVWDVTDLNDNFDLLVQGTGWVRSAVA